MDTSSISSNKITLKISTPQGREMALNKGELLQAQVQEVGEDGSVTIMVKGKPIEAFSEVPVKPGQQLLLMVDDLKQGKTYLKVVTPELMGKIETTNISANLVEMGITAREDNIMLARKLLQHNLPVTQNNLSELSRNVSSLGGMNAKNLEIGAFALSRGISGKEALTSLARFLSSPGETDRLMSVLERLVNVLTVADADGEAASQAAAAKNIASSGSSAASAAASATTANINPDPENPSASARNTIPNQSAARDLNSGSSSQTVQNRPAAQTSPGNQLFNAGVDADNTASPNQTIGPQNTAAAGNASGAPASAANELPAANMQTQAANQAVAVKNSSLLPGPESIESKQTANTTASGGSEVRESILPGRQLEPETAQKTVQAGATTNQTAVEGEALPPDAPKPTAGGMAGQAPEAGARAGSAAGSPERTVATMIADGEPLTGSGIRNSNPASAQTSAASSEKAPAAKQNEAVLTLKPTASPGNTALQPVAAGEKTVQQTAASAQNIPSAGTTENTAPLAAAGEKTVPASATTAPVQATVTSGMINAAAASSESPALMPNNVSATGAKTPQPADIIMQAGTPQVSTDELMTAPAVLPAGADRAKTKTAAPGTTAASEPLKQNIANLLDAMRSLMEVDLQDAPEKIAGKLQSSSNIDKDIVKALNLLVDMAKNPEMTDKIPELKDFSRSLDRLEKEMSGQQLFNLSSRSATDNLSGYYYFAFPVKIDQEYSMCQLKINKDGRKNLKEADKLSFVVSLNTSKLGLVLFHINWQRSGSLQLQGVAESQASSNFLNQNIGELVSKLEELGYSVKNMGVKVSSSEEELRVRPVLQEVTERLRPLGIDVTV